MSTRRFALAALFALAATPVLFPESVLAAAEKTEKKKGGGETFVQLPTLTATVMLAGQRRGVITVEIGVDVPDGGLRKRAEQSIPLLRAAFTQEMLTYAPSIAGGGVPNPDILSLRLQQACDRTLGRPGAKLLLGSILIN